MLPPVTLAVVVILPTALTAPVMTTLFANILPAADTLPDASRPMVCMLPLTVSKLGPAVSNLNPALAPALPALLKITCVFDPGTVKLPVMLPANVPTKYPSVVMLPAELTIPNVLILPPVTLPAELSELAPNAPVKDKLPPAILAVVMIFDVLVPLAKYVATLALL